jgi:2'-hydroxyisoflavone reductase
MKILILGGTGFLGPEIVRAAQQNKHELTLFNRGKTHPALFPDVEKLQGDRDKDDYKSLEGHSWDACIDTSANMPAWMKASTKVLKDKVKQYLFTSSISVYPMDSFRELGKTEDAPVSPWPEGGDERSLGPQMSLYGPGKAYCERIVQEAFPGHATIVRPGLIVGPQDATNRFTYWVTRIARGGDVLAPEPRDQPVQVIDARDLADFALHLAAQSTSGTFNAVGDIGTMESTLTAIIDAAESSATLHWLPEAKVLSARLEPWRDVPLWLAPASDPSYAGFLAMSNARAKAA